MNILEALRSLARPCVAVLITSDKCYDNVEWVSSPATGLIHHSDRGTQYTSHAFQAKLKEYGMTGSPLSNRKNW